MGFGRRHRDSAALWVLAGGLAAGVAAAVYFGIRAGRRRSGAAGPLRSLEDIVIKTLRRDTMLRKQPIDVAAVGSGIIELSGTVQGDSDMERAVTLVQGISGVNTVVNRLDVHERAVRRRPVARVAGGGSSRWYGMGVGMGRRRQSAETDPAQRDDHAALLDKSIESEAQEALAEVTEERQMRSRANEVL